MLAYHSPFYSFVVLALAGFFFVLSVCLLLACLLVSSSHLLDLTTALISRSVILLSRLL